MKEYVLTACLLAVLHYTYATPVLTEKDEYLFKTWMSEVRGKTLAELHEEHNKQYDLDEYYQRLQIFIENSRRIDQHNAGNHRFKLGQNQFADLTFAEFKKQYLLSEPQNCSATKGSHVGSSGPYPDSIDWRKKGHYVTDVKNQGSCGSCWTFSTTGCLESVTAIATGKLPLLAEQQLVDCAGAFNNHGCKGGLPSQAFEYIKYNKGIMTEDDYPYTARDGPCKYNPQLAAAFVKEVVNITMYEETELLDAVARFNPVSFAFEVTSDFMFYSKGVYSSTECHNTTDKVNHAVLAVGYAEENGTPYWIVKNSWGATWGIDGYFYIERGKNMCGLAACASYPLPVL